MLTASEERIMAETGLVPPSRLRSLQHALRQYAAEARRAATEHPEGPNSQAAAALRGKAKAYGESAHLLEHIMNGQGLHPRRGSLTWLRSREINRLRRERFRARVLGEGDNQ